MENNKRWLPVASLVIAGVSSLVFLVCTDLLAFDAILRPDNCCLVTTIVLKEWSEADLRYPMIPGAINRMIGLRLSPKLAAYCQCRDIMQDDTSLIIRQQRIPILLR